jgi:hypothetical protein
MSSALTFTWASQNLAVNQCRGCGRITQGWGRNAEPKHGYRELGPYMLPVWDETDSFALCSGCGGSCCGDCRPGECEFGIEGGGPSAVEPEEKKP